MAAAAMAGGLAAQAGPESPTGQSQAAHLPAKTSAGPGPRPRGRMEIAEALGPTPGPLWRMAKQCGVDYAVGSWRGSSPPPNLGGEPPWSYKS
jgi:hypothetical protein